MCVYNYKCMNAHSHIQCTLLFNINVNINDHLLDKLKVVKYLGFCIDDKL